MNLSLPWRRTALYYGWWIVLGAFVAQFVAAGISGWVTGVFLKPMTTDLGWTRGEYSMVQTVATVVSGILGFAIGGMIDVRGPRRLMLAGSAILGASLILTSRVDTLWEYYLARGVAQTIGNALIGNLVVNVTVSKWFVARRGMAMASASAGLSLGGVVLVPLTQYWVDQFGWRGTWVVLGLAAWAVMLPVSLLMRRSPEDYGMHPDGLSPEEALHYSRTRRLASAATEVQWTRPEASRTFALWLVILAYGSSQLGQSATVLHSIPLLTDNGFSSSKAVWLFTMQAWAALISKPIWGALMQRIHARVLSAWSLAAVGLSTIAIVIAAQNGSTRLVALAFISYGLSVGGNAPLQETVWGAYFGRVHIGKIRALAMPFTILFGAGGPWLAGTLYDRTGDYFIAYMIFGVFSIVGCLLIVAARPPNHPSSRPTIETIEVAPAAAV